MEEKSLIVVADKAANNLQEHNLDCCFPKTARLRFRRQFEQLGRFGQRFKGQWIIIEMRSNRSKTGDSRLGVTVTKKFGKAHDRNRFKRIVREAYRICKTYLRPSIDINIRPSYSHKSNPLSLKTQDIERELLAFLRSESDKSTLFLPLHQNKL